MPSPKDHSNEVLLGQREKERFKNYPLKGNNIFTISTEVPIIRTNWSFNLFNEKKLSSALAVFLPSRCQGSGLWKPCNFQSVVSAPLKHGLRKDLYSGQAPDLCRWTTTIFTFTVTTGNDLPRATPSIYKSGEDHGLINLNWFWSGNRRGMTIVRNMVKWKNYFLKSLFFKQKTAHCESVELLKRTGSNICRFLWWTQSLPRFLAKV